MTHDSKTKKTKLNIRLPIEYRRDRIIGLLHHEIGTHFIRKFNDRKQKWHGKKQYDIKNCIVTEEGLACVNQMIEKAQMKNKSKFLYKAALNYYTAYQASTMSFVELYNDLATYQEDPVKRWRMCLWVKRGMTDTSKPGGLYKDQVYLAGALSILKYRKHIDFVALFSGKISLSDLNRPFILRVMNTKNIKLPYFVQGWFYNKALDTLAKANFIT